MHRSFLLVATALLLSASMPAFAAGMDMPMTKPTTTAREEYRFMLSGSPKSDGFGKSIVSVKLLHDDKPVVGAIIISSRADMSPIGMADMTGAIKPLGEQPPGNYRFEIANGSVWKRPDNWSLSFSAKVQGVTQTVTGSVTVRLAP